MRFGSAAAVIAGALALASLGASLAASETQPARPAELAASLCHAALGREVVRAIPTTVQGVLRTEAFSTAPRSPPWWSTFASAPETEIAGLCWVRATPRGLYALYGVRRGETRPAKVIWDLPKRWVPSPTETPGRQSFPPGVLPGP